MDNKLYRQEALDKRATPDDLDRRMVLTKPRHWMLIVACILLSIILIGWGFLGRINIDVKGVGMLMPEGGITELSFNQSGKLTDLAIRSGEFIESGALIGKINGQELSAIQGGRVLEVYRMNNEKYSAGDPLVLLANESPEAADLQLFMYVPLKLGKTIEEGMLVQASPSTTNIEDDGYVLGHVASVSAYPISKKMLYETLENESIVEEVLAHGPVIEVIVTLEKDSNTYSGFSWTTVKGPHMKLNSGTICESQVVIKAVKPISFVIPAFSN